MQSRYISLRSCLFTSCCIAVFALPSFAQDDKPSSKNQKETGQIEEIIVTATRTETLASKTSVALTALSSDDLAKVGVVTTAQLADTVPNLALTANGSQMQITIRGITSNDNTEKGDPSAAFMINGIYLARQQEQNVGLYDVARVEVLRGPQGTLYGRNTTAGAINVITNDPTWDRAANLHATVGDYNTRIIDGMVNLPVSDWLAVRGAFSYNAHDSYLYRSNSPIGEGGSRNDLSMRLSVKMKLGDKVTLVLRGDDSQMHSPMAYVPLTNFYPTFVTTFPTMPTYVDPKSDGARTDKFSPTNISLINPYSNNSTWGVGADLTWDLGLVTLTYQGSHREFHRNEQINEWYGRSLTNQIGFNDKYVGAYREDSHEMRVSLNDAGPLKLQAGLYYFNEVSHINRIIQGFDAIVHTPYYQFPMDPVTGISRAAFAQATYEIIPSLRAIAGIRYSAEHKSRYGLIVTGQAYQFNPSTDGYTLDAASLKENKVTWRTGLEYDVTDDIMWYGTVATGYKAGGFNDGCLAGSSHTFTTLASSALTANCASPVSSAQLFYQPEKLTSYESGVKAKFWDHKAMVNLTGFYYDYTNLQLSGVVTNLSGAPVQSTTNAANARVLGLEAEGEVYVTEADHVTFNMAVTDAQYLDYSPNGTVSWNHFALDRSPKTVIGLGYDHTFRIFDGSLVLNANTRYSSKSVLSIQSKQLQYPVPSTHITNFSADYAPDQGGWDLQFFLHNIEDKVVPVSVSTTGGAAISNPRTFGARFSINF